MPEEEKKLSKIRNIGIIAHIDAGKTTTTERILYHTKKTYKVGDVHKGDTVMDFDPQEQEKGITIQSAATTVDWKEHQLNIIDTPGHIDFTAEVERSLRVLDGGIVVMDGKKGVESQTETVWRQANRYRVPRIIFVNKMDGVENEEKFTENLKSIQEKLRVEPLPIQFPIGAGRELEGIVDIIEQKAYYYHQKGDKEKAKDEECQIKEIPAHLLERTKKFRQQLLEKIGKIIEQNEELLLKHLEGQELSAEEIKKLLRQATLTGEYFPVFCGSAYKHVGVKLLLDGVINYLPSPLDVGEIPTFSLQDKNKVSFINCNSPLSCLALAFKIVFDDRNQRVTFVRVYAGKIAVKSSLYNVNQNKVETVSKLVRMHANNKEEIKEVGAGDIAAIIGLEYAITGDTFGDKKSPLLLETISFAKPVISQAIEPKTNKDRDKLRDALGRLEIQDPSFRRRIDQETGQLIISGMGELHLEVSVEKLRRENNLEIEMKRPKVSYRETIKEEFEMDEKGNRVRKKVAIHHLHKKQTGGAGQRAEIDLEFESNPGGGFKFVNALKGERVGRGNCFLPAVEKGLESAFSEGPILGYPVVDVKVAIVDGAYHPVDSSELAFWTAARDAFKENTNKFNLILLEPIMQIEVIVPKNYMGDTLADLGRRRTVIENTEEKEGAIHINGKTPLKEILGYSTSLRQLTKGQGEYLMHLSHYQEVPKGILEGILKEEKL